MTTPTIELSGSYGTVKTTLRSWNRPIPDHQTSAVFRFSGTTWFVVDHATGLRDAVVRQVQPLQRLVVAQRRAQHARAAVAERVPREVQLLRARHTKAQTRDVALWTSAPAPAPAPAVAPGYAQAQSQPR